MSTRARWTIAIGALVVVDVLILLFQFGNVLGNCEAQFLIVTPQVIGSHLLLLHDARRRHLHADQAAERRHRELLAAHTPNPTPQED